MSAPAMVLLVIGKVYCLFVRLSVTVNDCSFFLFGLDDLFMSEMLILAIDRAWWWLNFYNGSC